MQLLYLFANNGWSTWGLVWNYLNRTLEVFTSTMTSLSSTKTVSNQSYRFKATRNQNNQATIHLSWVSHQIHSVLSVSTWTCDCVGGMSLFESGLLGKIGFVSSREKGSLISSFAEGLDFIDCISVQPGDTCRVSCKAPCLCCTSHCCHARNIDQYFELWSSRNNCLGMQMCEN